MSSRLNDSAITCRALGAADAHLKRVPAHFNLLSDTGRVVANIGQAQAQLAQALGHLAGTLGSSIDEADRCKKTRASSSRAMAQVLSLPASVDPYTGMDEVVRHLQSSARELSSALACLDPSCNPLIASSLQVLDSIPEHFNMVEEGGQIIGQLIAVTHALIEAAQVLNDRTQAGSIAPAVATV